MSTNLYPNDDYWNDPDPFGLLAGIMDAMKNVKKRNSQWPSPDMDEEDKIIDVECKIIEPKAIEGSRD